MPLPYRKNPTASPSPLLSVPAKAVLLQPTIDRGRERAALGWRRPARISFSSFSLLLLLLLFFFSASSATIYYTHHPTTLLLSPCVAGALFTIHLLSTLQPPASSHPPSLILSSDENIISLEFFFNLILLFFFFCLERGGGRRSVPLRNHFIFSFPRRTCVCAVPCTVPNDLILTHTVHVTDDGVYIKNMSGGGERKRKDGG